MREMEDDFIKGRAREWRMTRASEQRTWSQENGRPSPVKRSSSTASQSSSASKGQSKSSNKKKKLPPGCIDILVEDYAAEEEAQEIERERCVSELYFFALFSLLYTEKSSK